nr:unnamed protein product [Digitaria exilis]
MAAADSASAPSSSQEAERPAAPSMPTDPDFLSCVLQPPASSSSRPDADYVALRRLLLRRKPPSALQHRMEWRCNGKGYVAYRNFLLRRIDGGSAHSTPSNSGRWVPSPGPALSEADSWSSIRDLRTNSGLSRTVSISSKHSDTERHLRY